MFNGIIQNIGIIEEFKNGECTIMTELDLSDCKQGSSICCNGVCLTATNIQKINENFHFTVNIGEETMQRTNFGIDNINLLDKINIEKSLKYGDEIGGHLVYGHVDSITKILEINKLKNSWDFKFIKKFEKNNKFIVEKGSITINGISLTIVDVEKEFFSVSVIPHTFNYTNMKFCKIEDFVNIEFDYLARYNLQKNEN